MATSHVAMSDSDFCGYVYPMQNRRYYLALVVSILAFPAIALALILGTIVLVVPLVALMLWVGMRVFFAYMLGNSVLVSAENYPRVLALAEHVKASLGYTKPIYIFVYEQGSFNAYMRHLFFRRAIFLNSELLQSGVSDREIRWLIGRFVGYMRVRERAGVLGWVIRAAQQLLVFNVFLLPYERSMVYTGDRLALAEIDGDINGATAAIQKLLVGRELGYSVNPEGLIAQHRQVRGTIFGFFARMGQAFPHTTARYVELMVFAKAFFPEQFKAFESTNPGLPADLDQLGLSQLTPAGPRLARAPWGWTCAGATSGALLALVTAGWLAMSAQSDEYVDGAAFAIAAPTDDGAGAALTNGDAVPVATDGDVVAVSPPALVEETPPVESTPPNTHRGENGQLVPDPGCRWLNDLPNDFNVVCG